LAHGIIKEEELDEFLPAEDEIDGEVEPPCTPRPMPVYPYAGV